MTSLLLPHPPLITNPRLTFGNYEPQPIFGAFLTDDLNGLNMV